MFSVFLLSAVFVYGAQAIENDVSPDCLQPIVVGNCRALFRSWAYDSKKAQCVQFNYGGCGGNANRFETKEECDNKCLPLCSRPQYTGICMAAFKKFWFNNGTGECEEFFYGGCGSNGNNFETKQECERTCKK